MHEIPKHLSSYFLLMILSLLNKANLKSLLLGVGVGGVPYKKDGGACQNPNELPRSCSVGMS